MILDYSLSSKGSFLPLIIYSLFVQCMVPMAGVEPAQLSPLPPQDSVSTNSTTSALLILATLFNNLYRRTGCRRFKATRQVVSPNLD